MDTRVFGLAKASGAIVLMFYTGFVREDKEGAQRNNFWSLLAMCFKEF
jgi:hypothetical protein